MTTAQYIIPVISLAALCGGWVAVQLLARRMKTKNHFDHLNSSCGHCTCGGVEGNCTTGEK